MSNEAQKRRIAQRHINFYLRGFNKEDAQAALERGDYEEVQEIPHEVPFGGPRDN